MNEQSVNVEFAQLDAQIQQVTNKLEMLDDQIKKLEAAISTIQELESSGKTSVLVPIADGIFAKASVESASELLVHVGTDVVVPKTAKDTSILLERQLEMTHEYQEKLTDRLVALSQQADKLHEQSLRK